MKRLLSSYLVIVLTMISLVAMFTLRNQNIIETSKTSDETVQSDNKPEGTGLIFDDNGQDINIPYKPVHKEETNKEKKDDKSSSNESFTNHEKVLSFKEEQLLDIYNENLSYYAVRDKSSKPYDYTKYLKYDYNPVVNEVYLENQIARIEEKMNPLDKALLVKASFKLNDSDKSAIKKVLYYNNTENVNELMEILEKKLSTSEFSKIKQIFYKYNLL